MIVLSNVAPSSVDVSAPALDGGGEVGRDAGAPLQMGEGDVVGRDHARAGAGLDRHVGDRQAALHRQGADGRPGVLDHVAGGAVGADLGDRAQDHVLGAAARPELARVVDAHRLRPPLRQRLGGQDVLDLARADPERERAEGAVRGGVRVAAHDRHPGLRQPELRPDHMDDAVAAVAERIQAHAELRTVARRAPRAGPGTARPARRARSRRCGRRSRRCGRAGAPAGRRRAALRTPAGSSPRAPGAGRRRAGRRRSGGRPRPSRTGCAGRLAWSNSVPST